MHFTIRAAEGVPRAKFTKLHTFGFAIIYYNKYTVKY